MRTRFLPSAILSRKVSLLLTNMCVLRAGIGPPLAHSWKSLDLASHPTLTRDPKLVWKSAKRGEMLQVYPLHLPWKKKKKFWITKEEILPVPFWRSWKPRCSSLPLGCLGPGQTASSSPGWSVYASPTLGAAVEEENALPGAICGCVNYSR